MKNTKTGILCFLLITNLCAVSFAQKKGTFTAKDGTNIEVKLNDADPDHGRHASVSLGVYGMDGIKFGAVNYYLPKVFFVNASLGEANYMVDGNLFLFNTTKEKNVIHMVKMKETSRGTTKYLAKIPIQKRRSIGPHLGFGSTDYSRGENSINHVPFSAKYAIVGLSYLKSRGIDMEVNEKGDDKSSGIKLHLLTRINADAVFYFDRKITNTEAAGTKTIDQYSRKIGLRIYYDGRNSWYSKGGRMGFSYMVGVGYNGDKDQHGTIFAGLGLFYAFL